MKELKFFKLKKSELQQLVTHFDKDKSGSLSYPEFVAFLHPSQKVDQLETAFGKGTLVDGVVEWMPCCVI